MTHAWFLDMDVERNENAFDLHVAQNFTEKNMLLFLEHARYFNS